MSRNRIIYQCEGLYVGPAPATGYHYLSTNGTLGDAGDFNLIFPLHRVQTFNYQFTPRRTEVKELGWRSLVDNPIIETPEVTFEFSYYQAGILNEHRVGFNANYSTGGNSAPFYANNFGISLISGFWERSDLRAENQVRYPFLQTEPRNFFVPLAREGNDLNPHTGTAHNPLNINVLGVGNCYLTSYRSVAAVNSFPIAQMSYVGDNISVTSSGTGIQVPAIEPASGNMVNRICSIPPYLDSNVISVLRPGDISIDIQAYTRAVTGYSGDSGTSGTRVAARYALRPNPRAGVVAPQIYDLQHDFRDIKIQSYDINLELPRQKLYHVNYKYPLDRPIQFPVYATVGIQCLVGDMMTGSLSQFLRHDYEYDITVKLRNPAPRDGIGIQYNFKRAKLIDKSSELSIGPNRTAAFRWSVDLDPAELNKGMWISGELNFTGPPPINIPDEFLVQEELPYILQEEVFKIKIQGVQIY